MSKIMFFVLFGSTAVLGYGVFFLNIKDENDFNKILKLLFKIYVVFGVGVVILWILHYVNVVLVLAYFLIFVLEILNMNNQFKKGYYGTLFRGYETYPWKKRFIFNLSLNFSMLLSAFCLILFKAAHM